MDWELIKLILQLFEQERVWDQSVIFCLHLMMRAGVAPISGKLAEKSQLNDLHQIVNQLMESEVFDAGLHNYKSFFNLKANLTITLPENDLKKWILNNFSKYTLS